jgi:hypothetical protein
VEAQKITSAVVDYDRILEPPPCQRGKEGCLFKMAIMLVIKYGTFSAYACSDAMPMHLFFGTPAGEPLLPYVRHN